MNISSYFKFYDSNSLGTHFQIFLKKIKRLIKSPYSYFVIISGVLTVIWFWNHTYHLSGEEMFEIYNPIRSLNLDSIPWLYLTGSNLPSVSLYLARIPFFVIASSFYLLGIQGWIIQAASYFFLMVVGMVGVALFTKTLTGENKTFWLPFSAGAFYLLNPYSMSQIWGRFIYNGMFAWALLPIVLLSTYRWLNSGKKTWLLIFCIFSLILSHAYANPGFIVAIWLPLFILLGVSILNYKNNSFSLKDLSLRISLILFFWVLVNIWWIYPYLVMWKSIFSQVSSWQADLNSLIGVSQYFSTTQILLLKQGFLFQAPLYKSWFNQWWILGTELSVLILVAVGILTSIRKKFVLYLLLLFIISWVFVKGTNHPLGNLFYSFLFKNFTFMGAVRNSYEKLGIDWLLAYTIFFALGFNWLVGKYKRVKGILLVFFIIFILGFSVMPMWTGQLFGVGIFNTSIRVPGYYKQANDYLNHLGQDNLFDLPYLAGDGISYTWGFSGAEPSEFLFDRTSISKILRVKYYDNIYLGLQDHLSNRNFPKMLGLLRVGNIIIHTDEITGTNSAQLVAQTKEFVNTWIGVKRDNTIGGLSIYDIDKNLIVPMVYSPEKMMYVGSEKDVISNIINSNVNPSTIAYITKHSSSLLKNDLQRPAITYKKLTSTHYRVKVTSVNMPYVLILNDIYNNKWTLSIGRKSNNTHFLANGYSNGWLINKQGTYTIDIQLKIWPWD
jgi:hypothetical protein